MSSRRLPPTARLSVGVVCSVGVGPAHGGRSRNEDNYLLCREGRVAWREGDQEVGYSIAGGPGVLAAVADGMGGHEDGELASAAAVQAMARLYHRDPPAEPEPALRAFVQEAHRRLHTRLAATGPVKMGTTLTTVWVLGHRAYWVQVGDSRLYHWRGGRLTRVTRDHTRGEFARRDRRPLPKHPDFLSQNFIYGSRGLGDDTGLRIEPGVDTGTLPLLEGDRLVLCSDGLSGRVDDVWIADVLNRVPEPAAAAVALLEKAIAHHSDDNVTILVLRADRMPGAIDEPDDETTLVPL